MKQTEPVIGQLLHPLNDCVLVELKQSRKNVHVREGKYDTRTEGLVVAVPSAAPTVKQDKIIALITGRHVYFEEFKEGARIQRDGKQYSFIKIEDIRGYEDE